MFMFWTFVWIQILSTISGQSTTSPYMQNNPYLDQLKYPKSKYYYFYTPRSQARELTAPTETETLVEDRDEGYEAKWPSKVIHQQPIYVHTPVPYHKEEGKKDNYLLPILLLALLPLLLGALLLLPLLFSFLSQVLQLLALMQQTLQAINTGTGTGTGRRRRSDRHLNPFIVNTISSLFDRYIKSQQKYQSNKDI